MASRQITKESHIKRSDLTNAQKPVTKILNVTLRKKTFRNSRFRLGSTFTYYLEDEEHRQREAPMVWLRSGFTYIFNVDVPEEFPFYLSTNQAGGNNYIDPVATTDFFGNQYSVQRGVTKGHIIFTPKLDSPDVIYYQCGTKVQVGGVFFVKKSGDCDVCGNVLDYERVVKIKFADTLHPTTTIRPRGTKLSLIRLKDLYHDSKLIYTEELSPNQESVLWLMTNLMGENYQSLKEVQPKDPIIF